MIYQMDLLTLLLAPVISYLAAALFFSLFEKNKEERSLPANPSNFHYRNGQHQ